MTRAVVLGGGGPAGIGWESGLVTGFRQAGIDLAGAELVVGTSAGSVVGSAITSGTDLTEAIAVAGAPIPGITPTDEGMMVMFTTIGEVVAAGGGQPEIVKALGAVSEKSDVGPAAAFVAAFGLLQGKAWPENFACTAVRTDNGEFRLWDRAAGAPLDAAVASSCSVPGIFPPVPVLGTNYMDGGMRDGMNPDVAKGHDVVVAVSCFSLDIPEGFSNPVIEAISTQSKALLEDLRSSGAEVVLITPSEEFLTITDFGLSVMDPTKVQPSYEAGIRQAAVEAKRVSKAWASAG